MGELKPMFWGISAQILTIRDEFRYNNNKTAREEAL